MRNFNIIEFQKSSTATKLGIDNSIPSNYINNINLLVNNILDPLKDAWGSNIIVSSGFRSEALNKAIGGSTTSAHSYAYAADLVPENGKMDDFKNFVINWLKTNNILFDQYIDEQTAKSQWVHIGIKNRSGQQRKQYMLYKNGKYTQINPNTYKAGEVSITSTKTETTITASKTSSTTSTSNLSISGSVIKDYGTLTGKSVYTNNIDLTAIRANNIFKKSDAGQPELSAETGKYEISDDYLTELDEHTADELENINDIPKEQDTVLESFLEELSTDTVETIKGVKLSADGSYVLKQNKTIAQIMSIVQQWIEVVKTLKLAIANLRDKDEAANNEEFTKLLKSSIGIENDDDQTNLTFNVDIKSEFDRIGHALAYGSTCPVCGKEVKNLPPGSYCSLDCMVKDLTARAASFLMKPNQKYKEEINLVLCIVKILDLTTLTLNTISALPDLLTEISSLPEQYMQYAMLLVNCYFCELMEDVQVLMQKKNRQLTKLFKKIAAGDISKVLEKMNPAIEAVMTAIKEADLAFNEFYLAAQTTLNSLKVSGLSIDAESFAWCLTPRSFLSPLPYTAPDATKIFVNLPGATTGGQMTMKPLMPSALESINWTALDEAIKSIFPPLTTADYFLEPEYFKVRYLLSDQSNLVKQIRQQLEDILKAGPDYLPKFENLLPIKKYTLFGKEIPLPNVGYLWFIMGLMDAWAPHSQALVGSILNPAI